MPRDHLANAISLNTIMLGEADLKSDVSREGPPTLHDEVLARINTLKSSIERTNHDPP